MKRIFSYSIITLLASLLFLPSCNKNEFMELDKGHNELQLTVSSTEIILNEAEHSSEAINLSWTTGTNYGTGNKIFYTLEIDRAGNNFASPIVAILDEYQVYSWKKSVNQLNNLLLDTFSIKPGDNIELEARVSAQVPESEKKQESIIGFKVTTYKPVTETLYLIGSATPEGWSADKATAMTRKENGIFTWSGKLNAGEMKFILTLGQFSPSYAKGEDGKLFYRDSDDQPDEKFIIETPYRYQIDVNLFTNDIAIIPLEGELPAYEMIYFIGNATGWTAEPLRKDVLDPFLFRMGRFFETEKGGEFKFATAPDSWENMYKATEENASYTNQSVTFVSGFDPDYKWFLKDEECGKAYKICFDIRVGKERMMMTEFIPYEGIWMVGDATPNGWDLAKATALNKKTDYVFEWEGQLKEGEIKFSCDKQGDWNGAWFMSVKGGAEPTGEAETAFFVDKSSESFKAQYIDINLGDIDNKWKITAAGNYQITLDQLNEAVTIIKK